MCKGLYCGVTAGAEADTLCTAGLVSFVFCTTLRMGRGTKRSKNYIDDSDSDDDFVIPDTPPAKESRLKRPKTAHALTPPRPPLPQNDNHMPIEIKDRDEEEDIVEQESPARSEAQSLARPAGANEGTIPRSIFCI